MVYLKDVAEIVMGQSPSGDRCYLTQRGLPLLNGPSEFSSHHPIPTQWTDDPKRQAIPGDLLFCVRGSTTGRMNWADQDYAIGRGLAAIRHRSGVKFQPWIRGVVEAQLSGLLNAATGSTFPNVSKDQLHNLEVPDHSPFEQEEIASILGALDDKIELNRRMAATLEEMARALYRSWFVDFDPVKAKAEGLAPAFMDEATAALFPDRFGDDGLPEGWKKGVLGELIEFNPRETLKKGAEAPYLDMKALPTSGMISDAPYPRVFSSGTKFRSGDTLLARITPCLENGKTAMVDDLDGSAVGWGSTEFIVMRGRSGVPPAYPYCVARDADFRGEAIATMTGSSGRQRADADRISHLPCAVPPRPVIDAFGSQTGSIVKQVHAIGRQNRTLVALRDALLPKLMTGALRVGEARDQIEEVA